MHLLGPVITFDPVVVPAKGKAPMDVVGVLGLVEVEFVAAGVVVAGHNTMFLKNIII